MSVLEFLLVRQNPQFIMCVNELPRFVVSLQSTVGEEDDVTGNCAVELKSYTYATTSLVPPITRRDYTISVFD